MTIWSESYPGTVMAACGVTEGAFEVHHQTGRMLRIEGEARLCFDCGPNGGVYHPDWPGLAAMRGKPDDEIDAWDRGERVASPAQVALAMGFLLEMARKVHDPEFNRFEEHAHGALRHSHTDGSLIHRHPEGGLARFDISADEVATGRPTKRTWHKAPKGEQLAFVEPTSEERTFRVVLSDRYINPDQLDAVSDKYFNSGRGRSDARTKRQVKGSKPPAEWGRAQHRADLDLYVQAIRLQALGHNDALVVGPGAIPLSASRMAATFRMDARYEIPGWTPTFGPLP